MSQEEQQINNHDEKLMRWHMETNMPERLWTYDDFTAVEDRPADFTSGLASLAFIKAAIWRSRRFLCVMTIVGLLSGFGLYAVLPPAYQASASVLLTFGPTENPYTAGPDDQAIAQSRTVATLAIHKLGLRQSVSSFLAAYTVSVVSSRVLRITVSAPSPSAAVKRANAVAVEFLRLRAGQLETQQTLLTLSLDQEISRARQQLNSISKQIGRLPTQSPSPVQQAELRNLQARQSQSNAELATLQQTLNSNQASTATLSAVKGSQVLDAAAPVPLSQLKTLLIYGVTGLIVALAFGVGIVVVRALMSDRLLRRDDVAYAIGAPVKVSVGTVRQSRWLPGRRGLRVAARNADVQRIVTHLDSAVLESFGGRATLAVVPVDDPWAAALFIASLAVSRAAEGKRVVLADLCWGAPAARLLGARKPGVRVVDVHQTHLTVAVPGRDDVLPAGPLGGTSPCVQCSPFTQEVAAACASADLLLTLATLDPSLGGEHLATWATAAIAVVTAGKSSATRIHAVGEMIRIGGTPLTSVILIGADPTDESLGTPHIPWLGSATLPEPRGNSR